MESICGGGVHPGAGDDHPREFCGLCGVYGLSEAARLVYLGLYALQHRGQESAGIAVWDGHTVRSHKGSGLLTEVVNESALAELPGRTAVGHVRYSTTGSGRIQNIQPLVIEYLDGLLAVAHNGNLVNARQLRHKYEQSGSIFQTSTDSEVVVHLLADPANRAWPDAMSRSLRQLKGAFSFLFLSAGKLLAARDPWGWRPLSIGKRGDAYAVASETCALDLIGFDYLRDNMAQSANDIVQRDLHYVIVDEVDSILIDEARTPLIISAPAEESTEKYLQYARFVPQLVENEDYNIDFKLKTVSLSEKGIAKMENFLGVKNVFTEAGFEEVHHIEQSLKAQIIFEKDRDYVVRDGQVLIVDEFTGRLMPGRRYSDGLHQALEAKENVEIQRESKTLATITLDRKSVV